MTRTMPQARKRTSETVFAQEADIIINYWRIGEAGQLLHFFVHIGVQIAHCQITWTMEMHPFTSQELFVNGRAIVLVADASRLGIERRETSYELLFVCLIDNDVPTAAW